MSKTLFATNDRQELIARMARLRPDAAPKWGRMSAPRMVAHLTEAFRMATGELAVDKRVWVPLRPLVRYLMIHRLPFPRNAPTAPQLLARVPEEWERDVERFRELLRSTQPTADDITPPAHPIFGAMTREDWGVLLWKHTDHHFTQFGV